VNRRFAGDGLVVVGICGAVVGAVSVARGVGFVFWIILALAAAGLIAAVLLRLLERFYVVDVAPLADRYRDWRAERRESQWLRGHPGEDAERRERMRP
jgi:hypothetical protein